MCVYRFGGLIDRCSALGVVYKCHLCSHSDACTGERELRVPPSNERVVSQDTLGRALGEARRIRYM